MQNIQIETPIGALTFTVETEQGDVNNFNISTCQIEPMLPDGMSIEGSIAVLLKGISSNEISNLDFSCGWNDLREKGYAASGEALEAWEWESNGVLVMVGTEDSEWINSRLKLSDEQYPENCPVTMSENKIVTNIEKYDSNKELSLHFIVAWNKLPEPVDCSCWYAVDVPHERVIKSCV